MAETGYQEFKSGKGYFEGMRDLFHMHDHQVLLIMTVVYAAQGLRTLGSASTFIYFKEVLEISDESRAQFLIATTFLPWYIKPVYGLIADSFPLFGYHRKSYLILAAGIGIVSYLSFLFPLSVTGAMIALIGAQLGQVVSDIMADALMVAQSRDDKEHGSSFLQAYSWTVLSCVSLLAGCIGFLLSSYGVHSGTILSSLSIAPAMVMIMALPYDEPEREGTVATCSQSLSQLFAAVSEKNTYMTMLFIYFLMASLPNILQVFRYYMTNELHISNRFIYFISGLGGISYICGSFVYTNMLKSWNFRKILIYGQIMQLIMSVLDLVIIFRLNIAVGINDKLFILLNSIMEETMTTGFFILPTMVLSARLCPHNLEATMYAFITSVMNFGSYSSELIGSGVTKLVMPHPGDYSNFQDIIYIQMAVMLIPFCLLGLLPKGNRPSEIAAKD